jgi:hypothetical protein
MVFPPGPRPDLKFWNPDHSIDMVTVKLVPGRAFAGTTALVIRNVTSSAKTGLGIKRR